MSTTLAPEDDAEILEMALKQLIKGGNVKDLIDFFNRNNLDDLLDKIKRRGGISPYIKDLIDRLLALLDKDYQSRGLKPGRLPNSLFNNTDAEKGRVPYDVTKSLNNNQTLRPFTGILDKANTNKTNNANANFAPIMQPPEIDKSYLKAQALLEAQKERQRDQQRKLSQQNVAHLILKERECVVKWPNNKLNYKEFVP
jgi:hypothetical protein